MTPQPAPFSSLAPANSMILGEHSVVYGYPAIACALEQWMTIKWQPISAPATKKNWLQIDSTLGQFSGSVTWLLEQQEFRFIAEAVDYFLQTQPKPSSGFHWKLEVKSEFSSTIGLGSSAAVLSATLVGLDHIFKTHFSLTELFAIGHQIILKIQQRGSGTDLAASLLGGILYFQPKSQTQAIAEPEFKKLPIALPTLLVYSGYKTPTAKVLEMVAENWQHRPIELADLYQRMGQVTKTAFSSLQAQQMSSFYQACQHYQQLMDELGVNDEILASLIRTLSDCPQIHVAKISGSGLGDCVLGLGTLSECPKTQQALHNYQQLQLDISPRGSHIQLESAL